MAPSQQMDDEGRCFLHPAIQLKSIKKNGEWRTLMNACPLCISGMPATGQSIPTRSSKSSAISAIVSSSAPSNPASSMALDVTSTEQFESEPWQDGDDMNNMTRNAVVPLNRSDESSSEPTSATTKKKPSSRSRPKSSSRREGERSSSSSSSTSKRSSKRRSDAPKKERLSSESPPHFRPAPPPQSSSQQQQSNQQQYEREDDDADRPQRQSMPMAVEKDEYKDNYQDFLHFLQEDKKRLSAKASSQNNTIAYNQQQPQAQRIPVQQQNTYHPPPAMSNQYDVQPQQQQQQQQDVSPQRQQSTFRPPPPKRPDPEDATDIRGFTIRQQQQQAQIQPPQQSNVRSSPRYPPPSTTQSRPPPPRQQQHPQAMSSYKPIEQDEVSVMSMSSVVRNMYTQQKNQSEASSSSSSSDDEEGEDTSSKNNSNNVSKEISTSEFDSKGRKKMFKGWQTLLSNCPECCLDEMRRVKDSRAKSNYHGSGGSRVGGSSRAGNSRSSKGSSGRRSKKKGELSNPPVTQVNVKSGGSDSQSVGSGANDDNESVGTASTITISSYTHSTGGNRGSWQNFVHASDGINSSSNDVAPARVTRMPYTDQYGDNGWYTGEVDGTSGTPNGMGTMNYSNGAVYEGEWRNGVSVSPSKTREEPITSGVKSMRHHGQHRPMHRPQRNFHRPPPRSSLEPLYEDEGSSSSVGQVSSAKTRWSLPQQEHQEFAPAHQRKVVCGMPWQDGNGDTGSYTGEVNSLNVPSGMGSMRYNNGFVAEGMWNDGEIDQGDDEMSTSAMSYQGGGGGGQKSLDSFMASNVRRLGRGSSSSVQ
ncbi:predicted protein [Thalassiosira pseudonana CCMP1335]|uniref:Uncharacterized protein n=1 Tax=Thalassiosira pseudonana TaxID=35128 RepID=B8BZN5_THAPS|nr:predicted protein [Thalassiosira pseudonana CCMP1335]EED92912.1 predicted protein [Thalassiosira pseudonana CCMP1335]